MQHRKNEMVLADSIFKDVMTKADKNYEGYNTPMVRREANYYLGYNLKNNGDLNTAFQYFKKCIEESKKIDEEGEESGFRINATLYSGTIFQTWKILKKLKNIMIKFWICVILETHIRMHKHISIR